MESQTSEQHAVPFWRDERYLQVIAQVAVVVFILAVLAYLGNNLVTGLEKQGTPLGFGFLDRTAGFDIGEKLIEYSRSSSYTSALLVGLLNTLLVAFSGIILATLLGIIVGVARLSSNWLVSKLASAYIELLRNVPLLVFLIFLSQALFKLPKISEALKLPGPIFFSNRGIFVPWPEATEGWGVYRWVILLALAAAIAVWYSFRQQAKRTGRSPLTIVWAPAAFLAVAVIGWLIVPGKPLGISTPALEGRNFQGGNGLTPEFMALLSGLVLYTASFIAEVVRAGIQSVSKGQREAATALGLSGFDTLRLVVFPQAMRVIIPPLTSQYLNLTKNSSLAVAVGYPDVFQVGNTILNQAGKAVEIISITMLVYLTFSLSTSLFMNWYNRRIRLVER